MRGDGLHGSERADRCVVCSGEELVLRYHVAGEAGSDGLIPTTSRFGTALADIVRCSVCGHMQLERFPGAVELTAAYGESASDDYLEEERGQRATAAAILADIELHVSPGDLLDMGCWMGFFLSEAERRGWRAIGVEPSDYAATYARERLGLDVRNQDLFGAELPTGAFDVVFLGDVMEHVPDAGRGLDRIASLLRPGGVVVMALPDAGSRLARAMGARWWSVLPTHVHYFTRRSMGLFLTRHGFEVLHMSSAPKAFTVRYYLRRIAGYSDGLARALVRLAERTRLADRLWAPDFRDRMLVIARRRSEDG